MSLNSNFFTSLNYHLCVVQSLFLVCCNHAELLQAVCLTIVTPNQACEHCRVLQVSVEVRQLVGLSWIYQIYMVAHPFKKDGFRHRVNV